MILVGSPNVMIGGFPLPSFSAIAQGLLKRVKGLKFEGAGGPAWVARRAGSEQARFGRWQIDVSKDTGRYDFGETCRSNPRFVGDPIDVVTGANTDVITDVARRGPIPFEWMRYYNSARAATLCSSGLGPLSPFRPSPDRDLDGCGTRIRWGPVGFPGRRYRAIGQPSAAWCLTRTGNHFYYRHPGRASPARSFNLPGSRLSPLAPGFGRANTHRTSYTPTTASLRRSSIRSAG